PSRTCASTSRRTVSRIMNRLEPVSRRMTMSDVKSNCVRRWGLDITFRSISCQSGYCNLRHDELVACTVNCQQMLWVCWVGLKFLAQTQDVVIDSPSRRIVVISPHLVQ